MWLGSSFSEFCGSCEEAQIQTSDLSPKRVPRPARAPRRRCNRHRACPSSRTVSFLQSPHASLTHQSLHRPALAAHRRAGAPHQSGAVPQPARCSRTNRTNCGVVWWRPWTPTPSSWRPRRSTQAHRHASVLTRTTDRDATGASTATFSRRRCWASVRSVEPQ